MAEVTYYWNAYTDAVWTDPGNMIDGLLTNYGSTATDGAIQVLDGNTCLGTDLGTITAVEGRAYGYGDADDQIIVYFRSNGGLWGTLTFAPGINPVWSSYQALAPITWVEIVALLAKVEFNKSGKGNTMHCAKVEIRVTYTPVGAKVTQYLNGNDCPVFPHNMNVDSGKLPCPPPY